MYSMQYISTRNKMLVAETHVLQVLGKYISGSIPHWLLPGLPGVAAAVQLSRCCAPWPRSGEPCCHGSPSCVDPLRVSVGLLHTPLPGSPRPVRMTSLDKRYIRGIPSKHSTSFHN